MGLTTALAVLRTGWVIVGSLPTTDGMSDTAQAGCLLVLDSNGNVAETFYGSLINGPWDMAALDNGSTADLFVTNVLNGTVAAGGNVVHAGTVLRMGLTIASGSMPALQSLTIIGSGFRSEPIRQRWSLARRAWRLAQMEARFMSPIVLAIEWRRLPIR